MGSIFYIYVEHRYGTVPYGTVPNCTVPYSIIMTMIRISIRTTVLLYEGLDKDYNCIVSLKISETQKHYIYPSHPYFKSNAFKYFDCDV